ncbi:uncharacterized protein J4E79_005385 [Alternaria viburni]|uniref:uncharacterized protein n=1 Tax=Alternaria viburni TaxID=566460 RepID=UPI0020C4D26A|nr:uncharacterized protein J4E79_005385 [Alternaria viburni]KAI4660817.1 hypothetical protein J4E79_005385 [Alternaria viburni]
MYKQLQGQEDPTGYARRAGRSPRAASTDAKQYENSTIEGESDIPNSKPPTYELVNDKAYHDDDFLMLARTPEPSCPVPTKKRFFTGWRMGALASAICAILVFSMNLALTIWVWKNPDYEHANGAAALLLEK